MSRRGSRLWLLLLLVLVAGIVFQRVTRDPWPAQQGIAEPADEAAQTARVLASTIALVNRTGHDAGRTTSRGTSVKAHGCVQATVSVPELEPRLRHGVFARKADYPAWIRFSSGAARGQSDQVRDSRGLALKLMNVPGEKLLPSERQAGTQDFVLSDSPRFFVPDVAAYAAFVEQLAQGSASGYFFDEWSWKPWRWRLRELYLADRARRSPPRSLLRTRYYSQTPYRLGPGQIVKYAVRPCDEQAAARRDRTDEMLREGLRDELAAAGACLDLLVQLQVPGRNMPVEDATVEWSEADSPFVPVARISVPQQVFDTPEQDRFCEDLSFTPWHSLPENEPVGGLNRLRRVVYQEVSRYRHARNAAPRAEPRGFCLDLTGTTCGSGVDASTRPAQAPPPSPAPGALPTPAASAGGNPPGAPQSKPAEARRTSPPATSPGGTHPDTRQQPAEPEPTVGPEPQGAGDSAVPEEAGPPPSRM